LIWKTVGTTITVKNRPKPDVHQASMNPNEKSEADLRFRRKQTFVFDTRISGAVIQRQKSSFQTGGRHCSGICWSPDKMKLNHFLESGHSPCRSNFAIWLSQKLRSSHSRATISFLSVPVGTAAGAVAHGRQVIQYIE